MNIKKNILYVFHVSFIGGGSLCLLNLVKAVDKEKFNPIVLLKAHGPLCTELEKVGASVFIEPSLNTVPYNRSLFRFNSMKQILKVLFSIKKVESWIYKLKPEILHINTMMMYPYAIPGKRLKTKVIIHAREHWPRNENIFQLNFAKKIINKYADLVIAINKTSSGVINLQEKTEIIYDWIDFNGRDNFIDFKTLFGKDYKQYKVYLFLGGISRIKGLMEVTKAFNNNLTSKNDRLLIVGCDSKEIIFKGKRGKVKKIMHLFRYYSFSDKFKLIAQKNDRIVCIPATSHVKSLIEQAYCTLAYPTIPHAILPIAESIYLGKPVLSANTPEALEYCNNGKGATLFPMNNELEFIKALKYVSENELEVTQKAIDNKDVIKDIFSLKHNREKLNRLYNNILVC